MIIEVKNDSHPRFNTSYLNRVRRESSFSLEISTSAFWLPSPPSMSFFLGLVHTYPVISENWDFFSSKKKKRVFDSSSPVNTKTLKQWKYYSIPYRALSVDMERISRHRVDEGLKAREKESSVFKNIRIRVDGALIFPFKVPLPPPPPHNYWASLLPSNAPPQPLLVF